jgi:hypothetical protein
LNGYSLPVEQWLAVRCKVQSKGMNKVSFSSVYCFINDAARLNGLAGRHELFIRMRQ